jgi:hypothetical protein
MDPFELLPSEILIHIISFFPTRNWFLLSKRYNSIAFEGMPPKTKLKTLLIACEVGDLPLLEKCLKVRWTRDHIRDLLEILLWLYTVDCIGDSIATV